MSNGHIFFIYDHRIKTEEDDPSDAILYFYPRSVTTEQQIAIVGGIIGITDFCLEFLPGTMPSIAKLCGHSFALLQHEDFIIGLADSSDTPDKFLVEHMQFVWSTFTLYQESLGAIRERVPSDAFVKEIAKIWDMYLPLCQLHSDPLSQAFKVLPYVQLHKSQGSLYLHASHILQRTLRYKGVMAGALFSWKKVLCSQLSKSLTRQLLLLMTQSQFPCVETNSILELPGGVRLLQVFLPPEEYAALCHRRKKTYHNREQSLTSSIHEWSHQTSIQNDTMESDDYMTPGNNSSLKSSVKSEAHDSTSKRTTGSERSQLTTNDLINKRTSGTDSDVFLDTLTETVPDKPSSGLSSSLDSKQLKSQTRDIPDTQRKSPLDLGVDTSSSEQSSVEKKTLYVVADVHTDFIEMSQQETLQKSDISKFNNDKGKEKIATSGSEVLLFGQTETLLGGSQVLEDSLSIRSQTCDGHALSALASQNLSGMSNISSKQDRDVNDIVKPQAIETNVTFNQPPLSPSSQRVTQNSPVTSTDDIPNGSTSTDDIPNGSTSTDDIPNGSTSTDDIPNGSTSAGDIPNGSVLSLQKDDTEKTDLPINNIHHGLNSVQIDNSSCSSPADNVNTEILKIDHCKYSHEKEHSKVIPIQEQTHCVTSVHSSDIETGKNHPQITFPVSSISDNSKENDAQGNYQMSVTCQDFGVARILHSASQLHADESIPSDITNVSKSATNTEHSIHHEKVQTQSPQQVGKTNYVQRSVAFAKREIEASLEVRLSGDDESSAQSSSETQQTAGLDSSTTSIADSSEPDRSKMRLLFEGDESDVSDGGVLSPLSEMGRAQAVEAGKISIGKSKRKVFGKEEDDGGSSQGRKLSEDFETYRRRISSGASVHRRSWNSTSGHSPDPARTPKSMTPDATFDTATDDSTASSAPSPQRDDLIKTTLYAQGHSDTLLVLLLNKDASCSKSYINSLWKTCLSHLAELDFEVKDAERHMKDDAENLGAAYQYMRYDSFSQSLKGSALLPISSLANEIVDSCVKMHETFDTMPDVHDVTYRSHSACCWGHRALNTETFFQLGQPRNAAGICAQNDRTFSLDQLAGRILQNDTKITVL